MSVDIDKIIEGKLIAVEGLDGSGKSTQANLLARWLESEGHRVYFTEWNSSELVRDATRRGKKRNLLTPTTFSLIHCTDFADRYERLILPRLKAGYIVVADRYKYTAFVRDSVRGCSHSWIEGLYNFAVEPDITFFFELPLDTALRRILSSRPRLKFHEAGMDMGLSNDITESFKIFQGLVNDAYHDLVRRYNFTVIDSTRPAEMVQKEIRHIVSERIALSRLKWAKEV